jgi:hypothetical protein
MRLRGLLVAPIVLAGCAGGGHAAPKVQGVYRATVRDPGEHAIRTVWLDARTGRFRVRTVFHSVGTSPVLATVTVFDGREATEQVGRSRLIRITGSRRFVADRAGAHVVAPLRAKLTGSAMPDGVTVVGFQRLRHVDPGLFRVSSTPATGTVHEVSAGRSATGAEPAYWLGSAWRGMTPAGASESTGDAGTVYETRYPGVDVTVERAGAAALACDGTRVRLADGTPATVVVIPIDSNGTGQCSSSSDGSATAVMVVSSSGSAAGAVAYVIAGDAVISLSGRAVTPRSAAAIARALRPV